MRTSRIPAILLITLLLSASALAVQSSTKIKYLQSDLAKVQQQTLDFDLKTCKLKKQIVQEARQQEKKLDLVKKMITAEVTPAKLIQIQKETARTHVVSVVKYYALISQAQKQKYSQLTKIEKTTQMIREVLDVIRIKKVQAAKCVMSKEIKAVEQRIKRDVSRERQRFNEDKTRFQQSLERKEKRLKEELTTDVREAMTSKDNKTTKIEKANTIYTKEVENQRKRYLEKVQTAFKEYQARVVQIQKELPKQVREIRKETQQRIKVIIAEIKVKQTNLKRTQERTIEKAKEKFVETVSTLKTQIQKDKETFKETHELIKEYVQTKSKSAYERCLEIYNRAQTESAVKLSNVEVTIKKTIENTPTQMLNRVEEKPKPSVQDHVEKKNKIQELITTLKQKVVELQAQQQHVKENSKEWYIAVASANQIQVKIANLERALHKEAQICSLATVRNCSKIQDLEKRSFCMQYNVCARIKVFDQQKICLKIWKIKKFCHKKTENPQQRHQCLNRIVASYNAKKVKAANARIARLKAKRLRLSQKLSRNKKVLRTRRNKVKELRDKIQTVKSNKKDLRRILRLLRARGNKLRRLLRKADRLENRQKRRIAEGTLAKNKAVKINRVFGKITSWTSAKGPQEEEISTFGTQTAVKQALKIVRDLYSQTQTKLKNLREQLREALAELRRSQIKIARILRKRAYINRRIRKQKQNISKFRELANAVVKAQLSVSLQVYTENQRNILAYKVKMMKYRYRKRLQRRIKELRDEQDKKCEANEFKGDRSKCRKQFDDQIDQLRLKMNSNYKNRKLLLQIGFYRNISSSQYQKVKLDLGVYVGKMQKTQETLQEWSNKTKENCENLTGKDKAVCMSTTGYFTSYIGKFNSMIKFSQNAIKNVPKPEFAAMKQLSAKLNKNSAPVA